MLNCDLSTLFVVVRSNTDEELTNHFMSLLNVIERTEQYLSTRSSDLLEYCQQHLEGHLGIIVVFFQVLDELDNATREMLMQRLQQLVSVVCHLLKRINCRNSSGGIPLLLSTGGRPKYFMPKEQIERLHSYGMSWRDIANIFHVSERTLFRRQEYGIYETYSDISDSDVDNVI